MTQEDNAAPWPPFSALDSHGAAVLQRVEDRIEELGINLVNRYRAELVEYRSLNHNAIESDMLPLAIQNVRDLLNYCRSGIPFTAEQIENFRASAARRSHQFVSMQSVLHAYRIWGQTVWNAIHEEASRGTEEERTAVLGIAKSVMEHVDRVSVIVAQAFLEEASGIRRDHNVLRRDFMDALLLPTPSTEAAGRFLTTMEVELQGQFAVVLFRRNPEEHSADLRSALATARFHLQPSGEQYLAGIRDNEIVVICPSPKLSDFEILKTNARTAAGQLPQFVGSIGRRHSAVAGISQSYDEAHEAVMIGLSSGLSGQCLAYADVLLDNVVRNSPYSDALLQETIVPLRAYDAQRGTDLLKTLECYYNNRFNLSKAAASLSVQPNTVTYRLERIRELTGHDPTYPDGLLLLCLGLKRHRIRKMN